MELHVVTDRAALAVAVADRLATAIHAAVDERGAAAVAFSGGATPEPMLAELAGRALPWAAVTIFQVDERVAPDGHPDRNATALRRALSDQVAAITHLMPVTAEDLAAAAAGYAHLLTDACGGVLDAVHLGLGVDGHTASLVPGDPVLAARGADVALAGPYEGRRRMTLTYPVLNRARQRVWEVAGREKAAAVAVLLAGGDSPAARVARTAAALVVTRDAAPAAPAADTSAS